MRGQNIPKIKVNFYKTVRKKLPLISRKAVKKIVKDELSDLELEEINIIVVGKRLIKSINSRFLKKNKITDVISFNLGKTGEIYICRDFIKDEKNFIKLIFHGFGHIIGYDHRNRRESDVMGRYERKLITRYFEKK